MSDEAGAIGVLIDRYLAGELAFMPFWSAFMSAYTEGGLTAADEVDFASAYDIIYMGNTGQVVPADRAVGLLDESEVRVQLAAFQARRSGARSG